MTSHNHLHQVSLIGFLFFAAFLARADTYSFSTIPSNGNVSGAPGATIGWGYSITNNGTSDWLLATNLDADSFTYGTPTLLFDFPEVAPGATATEMFDPIGMTGLYEDLLNISAQNGSVDSGNFDLSAAWYDGDPFNGGNFIGDAVDSDVPYSATVTFNSGSTPELGNSDLQQWFDTRAIQSSPFGRRIRRDHRFAEDSSSSRSVKLILTIALLAASGRAQQAPLPSDSANHSGITRQQAEDILDELRSIPAITGESKPARRTRPVTADPTRSTDIRVECVRPDARTGQGSR